jgi:outer membrane protein insertion porin family
MGFFIVMNKEILFLKECMKFPTIFLRRIILLLIFLSCNSLLLLAQKTSSTESKFEITKISFEGNQTLDDDELEILMTTKESPGWFSQFMYNTFGEKFGSKPEYFDDLLVQEDIKTLIAYYHDKGFYDVVIEPRYHVDSAEKKIEMTLLITENRRARVEKIEYKGLDHLSDELKKELFSNLRIETGNYYEKARAELEINRVLNFLVNKGYLKAQFIQEESIPKRYLSTGNFALTFSFNTGQQYRFGETKVRIEPPREDITDNLVLRHLEYRQGEEYSHEKEVASERNLNRLDIFEAARVEQKRLRLNDDSLSVPMEVVVRPRDRNEISPEISISDENNAFNLGTGIGYTNRNFFGDARIFSSRLRVRTQSLPEWNFSEVFAGKGLRDTSVVGAVELQLQFFQPYFFTKSLSGSWTTSVSVEKQPLITFSILRSKIGLNNQFATYTYGSADWTLERQNPEVSSDIRNDTARSQTLLAKLRQEDQPQFNSILTLTLLRDKTNDIFSPTDGFFHSITVEESGILPKVFPGIRGDLPFSQYYKIILLGRWYQDMTSTKYNIFALKLRSGFQKKYSETGVDIPFNRRFFAGGSGSVRGWKARELGAMDDELVQFGGNFIFEGSVEMRIHYLRGFGKLWFLQLDNFWGVYFLDVGNVWNDLTDVRVKDIAAAFGFGLRYETYFGPFRIDYGLRLYDPKEAAGKQTIFQKRLFPDVLGNGVIHFGLGHAF